MIEANAIDYRRPLYSQWFVETNGSSEAWVDTLKSVIDSDDRLFVCQVRRPHQGWLDKQIWDWLNARI